MATLSKKPLQIYLYQEELDALKSLAQQRSISIADLVHQAVDRLLAEVPVEEDPALNIVGMFDSSLSDLAEKHDQYLAEFEMEDNQWQSKRSS